MEATLCRCNVRVACLVSAFNLVCLPTRPVLDVLVFNSTLLPFPSIRCVALLRDRLRQARALRAPFTLSLMVVVHVANAPTADVGAWGMLTPPLVVMPFDVLVTVTENLLLKLVVEVWNVLASVCVVVGLTAPEVLTLVTMLVVLTEWLVVVVAERLIRCNARMFGVILYTLVIVQLMYSVMAVMMEIVIATVWCCCAQWQLLVLLTVKLYFSPATPLLLVLHGLL